MKNAIKSVIILIALFMPIAMKTHDINIIPLPNKISEQEGSFILNNNQSIGKSNGKFKDAAAYLKGIISPIGYHL